MNAVEKKVQELRRVECQRIRLQDIQYEVRRARSEAGDYFPDSGAETTAIQSIKVALRQAEAACADMEAALVAREQDARKAITSAIRDAQTARTALKETD